MKHIGYYKEFEGDKYPSMRDFFETAPYPNMDKIVKYLKSGNEMFVTAGIPKNAFTGESLHMEQIGMNDGVYTWVNTLAYYVERYNLRLPKEFEDHILAKEGN